VRQQPVNHTRKHDLEMQNILSSQQFILTFAVFFAAAGSFAGLAIRDRRPRESLTPPLIPTTPLMLITAIAGLLALVHLVNLLGVKTGN
jgi:amino acid transporter